MNYIFQSEECTYAFYHDSGQGIVCRVRQNGRWSAEKVIVKAARPEYTVTWAEGSPELYMFCQDAQGDVILATMSGAEWDMRVVLKNQSDKIHTVLLSPIITDAGLSILYNIPAAEDRSQYLVQQSLSSQGQWSPASRIDKLSAMQREMYETQSVSREHLLLFYQTNTPQTNLGYREITPTRQSDFNIIHTTGNYISDSAFLTTYSGIHALYVVKSMFSNQLFYRKRMSESFSNPQMIYEGQRIENCLLSMVRDNLYISFFVNGQLHTCLSEDRGGSFGRPVRYKNKFCQNAIKATYLSSKPLSENGIFVRQVYVDQSCPWDVQMLPDMYEDFYQDEAPAPAAAAEPQGDSWERLRNQLEMARQQLEEKDQQIYSLTNQMHRRNEEMVMNERLAREETDEIRRRLERLERIEHSEKDDTCVD